MGKLSSDSSLHSDVEDGKTQFHVSQNENIILVSSQYISSNCFFVSRFVTMEGLVERLERAVTRLEKMSITMQVSNSMANGDCTNGIDGGKSASMILNFFCINRLKIEVKDGHESFNLSLLCLQVCLGVWRPLTSC